MRALLDTTVIIDYLNGVSAAKREILLYAEPMLSIVTWMETLAGTSTDDQRDVREFLSSFQVVPLDGPVAAAAVRARQELRLKLPDAIVWATALELNVPLVTRNSKDFDPKHPLVRIPYRLT